MKSPFWTYPVVIAGLVAVWHLTVVSGLLPRELVPLPTDVVSLIARQALFFIEQSLVTAEAAISGLLLALAASFLLSVITEIVPVSTPLVRSLAVLSQTVPVAAAAPIIFFVFGFGFGSRVLIVFLVSFFPILTVLVEELGKIDPALANQVEAVGLNQAQRFRFVVMPTLFRSFGGGIRSGAVLAVIGAAIAELVLPEAGLGRVIVNSLTQYNQTAMFAAFVLLMALGLTFSLIASLSAVLLNALAKID